MNLRGTPYDNELTARSAYMSAMTEGFKGTLEEFLDRERNEIDAMYAEGSIRRGFADLKKLARFDVIKKLIEEVRE